MGPDAHQLTLPREEQIELLSRLKAPGTGACARKAGRILAPMSCAWRRVWNRSRVGGGGEFRNCTLFLDRTVENVPWQVNTTASPVTETDAGQSDT